MKILFDTDIGTDVDDAVCLAYLLAHPACELLGITTVSGEAEKRASLASVLCKQAGREIPIYPGADQPMQGSQKQTVSQQAAALPRWPHESDFPQGKAIDFLYDMIYRHPGEIHLVTIGPLTNAGLLFSQHPDATSLLKGLVLMGGVFGEDRTHQNGVEWNIAGDITASEIVYSAPVTLHRSVGLDVTQQVVMQADEVRQQFTAPILRPVLDFAEIWFEQFFPSITFHDPLAVGTVFKPELCEYVSGRVDIDRVEKPGRTIFTPGDHQPPHQIAVTANVREYFDHFFKIVGR